MHAHKARVLTAWFAHAAVSALPDEGAEGYEHMHMVAACVHLWLN